jgi:polyamine oxidase
MFEQELYKLIEQNGNETKLFLNTKVDKIRYADANRQDIGKVIVETSDGTFEADHVICTFSLGVLQKQDQALFTPGLPFWKIEALQRFRMNVYSKIFFYFPKRFWDENEFIYYAGF